MRYTIVETEFYRWANNLQNKWREKKGYPIGNYMKNHKVVELGSCIEGNYARETGVNFLTQNIFNVFVDAIKNKEKGTFLHTQNLYNNLLSSKTLAFNLFAELSLNMQLATDFFSYFFSGKIEKVFRIIFEHSDGRNNENYINDSSSLSVFVEYKPKVGNNGFIGIEVKYSEYLNYIMAEDINNRYKKAMERFGIFKSDSYLSLINNQLQQMWLDHLLSLAHLNHKDRKYDEGMFVYLFPSQNIICKRAVDSYIQHFKSYNDIDKSYDKESCGFYPFYLEDFIDKLHDIYNEDWTNELSIRYLDKDYKK